jgi:hypothetical protein
MLGRQFYQEICERVGIAPPTRDRADAAQYVVDAVGRDRLESIVDDVIRLHYQRASNVHTLLARLPRLLRAAGISRAPITVLTTNYDAVLEPAFEAEGEPFDLFIYNHSGPYAGSFLHRSPDGAEAAIRRPSAYRRATFAGSVLIKMNGGVDPEARWPKTFLAASRDFDELSVRIPDVFPRVVWDLLQSRSILFLGHGLREPDVRALTRCLYKARQTSSWAVQLGADPADIRYWRDVAGVEIVDADLGDFVAQFTTAVEARLGCAS